jgi:hypothetical protein
VFTDHKPITYALRRQAEPWTARQQRQLSFIAEFTSDLQHVAGESKVVADVLSCPGPGVGETEAGLPKAETCLSQPHIIRLSPGSSTSAVVAAVGRSSAVIDYAALAAAQNDCADCLSLSKSSSLAVSRCRIADSELWCNFSTGVARPLVPAAWRQCVFAALHNIAHPGVRATRRLVSARFV